MTEDIRSAIDRTIKMFIKEGKTPPEDVRDRTPTVQDVKDYPEYYILGDGREIASQTKCRHGYKLTDSCPNCP